MLTVFKMNMLITQLEYFRLSFRQDFSFILNIFRSKYDNSVE